MIYSDGVSKQSLKFDVHNLTHGCVVWIGLSIPIDITILIIPGRLLQKLSLRNYERNILKLIFSATLLGTITCVIGIYGVWNTRVEIQLDGFYRGM